MITRYKMWEKKHFAFSAKWLELAPRWSLTSASWTPRVPLHLVIIVTKFHQDPLTVGGVALWMNCWQIDRKRHRNSSHSMYMLVWANKTISDTVCRLFTTLRVTSFVQVVYSFANIDPLRQSYWFLISKLPCSLFSGYLSANNFYALRQPMVALI